MFYFTKNTYIHYTLASDIEKKRKLEVMLVKIYIIVLTESRSLNEKGFGFVRISQTRKTKQ